MTLRRAGLLTAIVIAGVLWWRLRPGPAVGGAKAPVTEPRSVTRLATWTPAPPVSRSARIVAYIWASPLTLVGLVLGALSRTTPQLREGIVLFTSAGGLGGMMLRWRGFSAAALGHVVVTAHEPTERLLRHELVHVRQAERWGPLFVPLYLAGLLRYGYRRNPFERAAYRATEVPAT